MTATGPGQDVGVEALDAFFARTPRLAVAFSGGCDSSFLLAAALRAGCDVKAYGVRTAFQPAFEIDDARRLARELGAEFELYGRKPRREAVTGYLQQWQLADVANVRVKDLTSQKLTQLGIALAFVGEPDAVVVDDVESQLTMSQSEALVELLLDAARTRNVAIVVGVVERDLAAMADATVYLSKDGE